MSLFSLDSMVEHGAGLGRWVNHLPACQGNCKMTIVSHGREPPRLELFARRLINTGKELRYNYGVAEKELPWNNPVNI